MVLIYHSDNNTHRDTYYNPHSAPEYLHNTHYYMYYTNSSQYLLQHYPALLTVMVRAS